MAITDIQLQNLQEVQENEIERSSWLNEFLWTCAGVNKDVLRQCPSDWAKYAGIGGTILFTALMAALSGGYAMYFVFHNEPLITFEGINNADPNNGLGIAIAFGIFWGLLIFNLDRFIVNTMYSDGKHTISWGELKSGLPRIIMAIFLGIVISTPLEMKIFNDQINAQLIIDNGKRIEEAKSSYKSLYDELDKYEVQKHDLDVEKKNLEERLQQAQVDVRKEAEGTALSGKIGHGPIYEDKKKYENECLAALERWNATKQTDLNYLNSEIIRVKAEIKRQEEQIQKESVQNGFAVRYQAFEEVTNWKEHPSLAIVSLMITLLFVIIETAPTFFKMMMEDGPYDKLLNAEKHRTKVLADKRISDVNDAVNTCVQISTMKNEKRLEAEIIANQDILEKIAKAQSELLETAIEKWKEIEMKKVLDNPSSYILSTVPSSNTSTSKEEENLSEFMHNNIENFMPDDCEVVG